MTSEKQRIAIAEACGFKLIEADDGWWDLEYKGVLYSYGLKRAKLIKRLPDYLNDLNAMHDAEKVLTKEQARTYAAQRAEAFLRTIGKWEE